MTQGTATNISITKKPEDSAIEVRAEIPAESTVRYRGKALKEIGNEVTLDGFRKGNIPENILVQRLGEAAILERTASIAISDELPFILAAEKIIAIETPKVTITKLAPGNPIAFTAFVTIMPEVALPDYKALAKKQNAGLEKQTVSDEEVADMTRFLRRERARIDSIEKGTEPEAAHEEAQKLEESALPEIDDAFAQSLGAAHAVDLAARMRENMLADKGRKAHEKVRLATIEGILEKTPMTLPKVLIEHELDRMLDRLAHDIEHSGGTLEAYLKSTKKTLDDMRTEWRTSAEKRAKVHVIVHEIAAKENIKAPNESVAHELEHMKGHHPNVDEQTLRMHVESALLPEAVFTWLEEQK
jgi:FKBP-type peptidyl-prolyl cis-trans isomerase (trigger factor)